MQQASRGQPRTLVSPLPSPTHSHADSSFSVSRYAFHGPVLPSLNSHSMAPPLQRLGQVNGSDQSGSGQQQRQNGRIPSSQSQGAAPENQRQMEAIAKAHWTTFRVFLDTGNSQTHPRQNKAREKLTRLSGTQFQELSTDVYDEVIRRTKPTSAGTASLPPNPKFHPKRNQAREKLASLQVVRFKDLASDVFFEIERRFPSVMQSSGSHRSNGSTDHASDVGINHGDRSQSGTTKTNRSHNVFRQTAVIPTKSTMMEEDDTDQETDSRSHKFDTDRSSLNSSAMSDPNKSPRSARNVTTSSPSKIAELIGKIQSLEGELKRQTEANAEMIQLRRDMEEVLDRNDKLEEQVSSLKTKASERAVAASSNSDLARENEQLRRELAEQQQVTDEVRREAGGFLKEMQELSERESAIYEQAETLQARVTTLEGEVETWKESYLKIKTQLRQFKATSQFFSPVSDLKGPDAAPFVDPAGIIKDISVTKFQTCIDSLLRVARTKVSDMPECMKEIVMVVRAIQKDLDTSRNATASDPRVLKLKQRMSSTANNLMTACKNHANGGPLSPVSLVDAAASHLSSTVIEIVKICKLYSSPDNAEERPMQSLSRTASDNSIHRRPQPIQRTDSAQDVYERNYSPSPKSPQRNVFPPQNNAQTRPENYRPIDGALNGHVNPAQEIADKLRIFLENQTEEIVSAIQRLLSAIRSDAKTPVLQTYMGEIVSIVNGVTSSMREACEGSSSLRASAGSIVAALESCISRMREMENAASRSTDVQASKEFKQRLAGIAFDTAKQTKELSIILQEAQEGQEEVDLT